MVLGVVGLHMHLVGLCTISSPPLEGLPFSFPLWIRASATSSLNSLSFCAFAQQCFWHLSDTAAIHCRWLYQPFAKRGTGTTGGTLQGCGTRPPSCHQGQLLHVDTVLWHNVWTGNSNCSSLLSGEMPDYIMGLWWSEIPDPAALVWPGVGSNRTVRSPTEHRGSNEGPSMNIINMVHQMIAGHVTQILQINAELFHCSG